MTKTAGETLIASSIVQETFPNWSLLFFYPKKHSLNLVSFFCILLG